MAYYKEREEDSNDFKELGIYLFKIHKRGLQATWNGIVRNRDSILFWFMMIAMTIGSIEFIDYGLHIWLIRKFLVWIEYYQIRPDLWLLKHGWMINWTMTFLLPSYFILLLIGSIAHNRQKKYEEKLRKLYLFKDVKRIKFDRFSDLGKKKKITVKTSESDSSSISYYKDSIERCMGMTLESMFLSYISDKAELTFTNYKYPARVFVEDLSAQVPLKDREFYLGSNADGIFKKKLEPKDIVLVNHGDSHRNGEILSAMVFGILLSSPDRMVYVLDLKQEFFHDENKNLIYASYLGECIGILKTILSQSSDKLKVLVVHEATLFFDDRGSYDRDRERFREARKLLTALIDNMEKLNLSIIFSSTEQYMKKVLPSEIYENVTGKLTFKEKYKEGSNKTVYLPDTDRFGYWQYEDQKVMVQLPTTKQYEHLISKKEDIEVKPFDFLNDYLIQPARNKN